MKTFKDYNCNNTKEFGELYRDHLINISEDSDMEYIGYSCKTDLVQIIGMQSNGKENTISLTYDKFDNYFPLTDAQIENLIDELIEESGKLDMSLIGVFNKKFSDLSYDNKKIVELVKNRMNNG